MAPLDSLTSPEPHSIGQIQLYTKPVCISQSFRLITVYVYKTVKVFVHLTCEWFCYRCLLLLKLSKIRIHKLPLMSVSSCRLEGIISDCLRLSLSVWMIDWLTKGWMSVYRHTEMWNIIWGEMIGNKGTKTDLSGCFCQSHLLISILFFFYNEHKQKIIYIHTIIYIQQKNI